jgi:hypothetical protein
VREKKNSLSFFFLLTCFFFEDVLLGVEFDGAGAGPVDTRRTTDLHGLSLKYSPESLARIRHELSHNLDAYVPPKKA